MECAICGVDLVELRNSDYFCPACKARYNKNGVIIRPVKYNVFLSRIPSVQGRV